MTHEAIFKYFSAGKRMFDLLSTEKSPRPLKNKEVYILILKGTKAVDLDAGTSRTDWKIDYLKVQEQSCAANCRLTNCVHIAEDDGERDVEGSRILSHSLCWFLPLRVSEDTSSALASLP